VGVGPSVVNVHVGPVVVFVPSLAVTYHSYSVPGLSPAHSAVSDPEATPLFVAITSKFASML
jgi:hypothetical protein